MSSKIDKNEVIEDLKKINDDLYDECLEIDTTVHAEMIAWRYARDLIRELVLKYGGNPNYIE